MKIEAVKMMRNIRDQMSLDIKGMTFKEEQDYLRSQIKTFAYLTEIKSAGADETAFPRWSVGTSMNN